MKITVIGLGRLGAVAAGGLATAGHEVTGLDVDERRVKALTDGRIPFYEPGLEECLTVAVDRGNLRFLRTSDFSGCLGDVALIAAGTPASANGAADLSQVRDVLAWVKRLRPRNLALVMKSTVPPGSGMALLRHDLNGLDVEYIANPEFLREGRALHDWQFPDRIVLGAEPGAGKSLDAVREMYSGINSAFLVTDITSAEMIKYASNAFLATRISFINEMASLCDALGASVDAVSEGLALDGRMGSRVFAGVGYGGSCLPKDVDALRHLAYRHGIDANLLGEVARVNGQQRRLPIERLNDRFGGNLRGRKIGVLGLAFKPGTDDVREAASLDLLRYLAEKGARIKAFDPQAGLSESGFSGLKDLQDWEGIEFVASAEEAAEGALALALITEWPEIVGADWEAIAGQMLPPRFLFDGRNALDAQRMSRLGFEYLGVGRGDILRSSLIHADAADAAGTPGLEATSNRSIPPLSKRQSELRYA